MGSPAHQAWPGREFGITHGMILLWRAALGAHPGGKLARSVALAFCRPVNAIFGPSLASVQMGSRALIGQHGMPHTLARYPSKTVDSHSRPHPYDTSSPAVSAMPFGTFASLAAIAAVLLLLLVQPDAVEGFGGGKKSATTMA